MSIPPSPFRGRKRLPSPSLDGEKAVCLRHEATPQSYYRGQKLRGVYVAVNEDTGDEYRLSPISPNVQRAQEIADEAGTELIDETGDGGPDPDGEFEGDEKAIHIQREGRTRRGEKIPDYYIAQSDEVGAMAITPTRDSAAQVVHLYRQPGEEVIDETGDGGPDPDGEFEEDEKAIRVYRTAGPNKQDSDTFIATQDTATGHVLDTSAGEYWLNARRHEASQLADQVMTSYVDETGTGEVEEEDGDDDAPGAEQPYGRKAVRVRNPDGDGYFYAQDAESGRVVSGHLPTTASREEVLRAATEYANERGHAVEDETLPAEGKAVSPGYDPQPGDRVRSTPTETNSDWVRQHIPAIYEREVNDGTSSAGIPGEIVRRHGEADRAVGGGGSIAVDNDYFLISPDDTDYGPQPPEEYTDADYEAEFGPLPTPQGPDEANAAGRSKKPGQKSADLIEADTPDGKRYFTPAVPGEVKAVHVGRQDPDEGEGGPEYFVAGTTGPDNAPVLHPDGTPVPAIRFPNWHTASQYADRQFDVELESDGWQNAEYVDYTVGGQESDAVRDPQDAAEQDEVLGPGTHRNKDFHPRRPVPGDRVRVESHPSRHQQTSAALVRNFPDSVPESHRLRAQGNKVALDQSVFDHASEGTYELGDDGSHAVRESDGSVSTLGDDYPGTMYVLDEHGRKYPREQKDMSWLAGGRGEDLVPPAAQAPFARRRKSLQGKWKSQPRPGHQAGKAIDPDVEDDDNVVIRPTQSNASRMASDEIEAGRYDQIPPTDADVVRRFTHRANVVRVAPGRIGVFADGERGYALYPDENFDVSRQKGVELTAYAYAGPGLRSGGKSLTFHKGKSFTYHGKDVAWYDVKSSSAMGLEPHFTGVVKDRRGRTICFREGKRVQCPRNPKEDPKKRSSKPKPPAEQREPSREAQVQQAHPRTPQEFGQEGFLIRRDTPVDNAALECEWYVLEGVFRTYQFYANPSLARLNAVIRAQGEMSPSDVSMHDRLQRAFAMSPLAAGQVYRGVDLTYSAELAQGLLDAANNSMATGQPMQLPGYTPCSTRPDAQFFSKIRMCLTVTGGLLMGPEEMLLNVDTFVTVSQVLETEYGWDIHAAEVVELDPESAIPGMDPGQVQPADAPPPTGQKAFRVPPERDPEDTVEFQGEEITNQELADRMNDPKSPAGEWAENQRLTISGRRVLRARGYIESDEEILARQRDAGEQQKALDPRVRAGSRVRVSPTQARAAAFNNAGPPITDEGLAMGARPVTDAEFVQNATNYGDVPADMPHPYLGGVNLRYDNSNQIGLLDPQDVDIDLHEAEFLPEEDGKALDPRVRVGSRVMTQPTQATAAADNQRSLDEYENAGDYEYHPTDADYVMNNRRGGQTVTAINPDQHFDVDTTGYHHTFQADVGASTASSTYDIIPEEEPKSLYSARRKALRRKWLSDFGKRLG